MKLTEPQIAYYENVLADLHGGSPDAFNLHLLWREMRSVMLGNSVTNRDAREDLTVIDLCKRAAISATIVQFNLEDEK